MKIRKKYDPRIKPLVNNLPRCFKVLSRNLDFPGDTTYNQFLILETINQNKFLKLSELSRELRIDKSTTTRVISPLLKKDLVEKFKSETDGRTVHVALTKKGEKSLNNYWDIIYLTFDYVIKKLPENKVEQVIESLLLLSDKLEMVCDEVCCK